MSYDDNRDCCGTKVPTSCSPYTGESLPGIDLPDDPNANDVLKGLAKRLDDLASSYDLSKVIAGSLAFDPSRSKGYELLNMIVTAIKDLQDLVSAPASVSQEPTVSIDLSCLIPSSAYCYSEDNKYTYETVLGVLVQEVCRLKTQLENVQGKDTVPVYIPNY